MRGNRGEHPKIPRPRQLHSRPPEDRLTDAGLALHQERGRNSVGGVEEATQLRKLLFAADDLGGHQTATLDVWAAEHKFTLLEPAT